MRGRSRTILIAMAVALLPTLALARPDGPRGKDNGPLAHVPPRVIVTKVKHGEHRPIKKAPAPLLGASLPAFGAAGAMFAGLGLWRRRRTLNGRDDDPKVALPYQDDRATSRSYHQA